MVRTECAGCGHGALSVFADLGSTPLADVFEASAEAAQDLPRFPLRAATCHACGLAQLLDVVDDKLLYGADYGFRTAGSPSSLAYMKALAESAIGVSPKRGAIVEIGCNDGTLLGELIHAYGGRNIVIGVDPSGAAREAAKTYGAAIVNKPFTAEVAGEFDGRAGLVVAVNVAAHVADPHDFLEGIKLLLAPDGVAVVEFQYLPDLLAGCMFDLIYHEHRFFYSLSAFWELAKQHGLRVRTAWRTASQGGSLRVVLDFAPAHLGATHGAAEIAAAEGKYIKGLLAGFQDRARYARDQIVRAVSLYQGTVWGYAASAKSCTLLNYCKLGPSKLPYIMDATPSKHGRFAPGTGIPVITEFGPMAGFMPVPDAYLLLASNYLGGIVRREQAAGYQGQFIIPLPLPVIA